jgi:hypothetical protein
MMTKIESAQQLCDFIYEQIGKRFVPCDYFVGLRRHRDDFFFNIIIDNHTCLNNDIDLITRIAGPDKTIIRAEPNGVDRVAVYINSRCL